MHRLVSFDRASLPQPPVEVADEVELYAREHGRTGSLRLVPTLFTNGRIVRATWVVDFELRPNDPRMQLWRDGKTEKPPREECWLHEPNPAHGEFIEGTLGLREPTHIGLDINQLGKAGIREFLERTNSWSGQGEHESPLAAAMSAREYNSGQRARVKEEAREENNEAWRYERRKWLGIPQIVAGIDLRSKKKKASK